MECPKCGSRKTEQTDYDNIYDGQGYESSTIKSWICHNCGAEWDVITKTVRKIEMRTKTVRVTIPVEFDVSYILEVESIDKEDIINHILSDNFDPSKWESDPCFYEKLYDAIRDSIADRKAEIEIGEAE